MQEHLENLICIMKIFLNYWEIVIQHALQTITRLLI